MAELSRFFESIIRMFAEHGGKHHTPHFHAVSVDHETACRGPKTGCGRTPAPLFSGIFWALVYLS